MIIAVNFKNIIPLSCIIGAYIHKDTHIKYMYLGPSVELRPKTGSFSNRFAFLTGEILPWRPRLLCSLITRRQLQAVTQAAASSSRIGSDREGRHRQILSGRARGAGERPDGTGTHSWHQRCLSVNEAEASDQPANLKFGYNTRRQSQGIGASCCVGLQFWWRSGYCLYRTV